MGRLSPDTPICPIFNRACTGAYSVNRCRCGACREHERKRRAAYLARPEKLSRSHERAAEYRRETSEYQRARSKQWITENPERWRAIQKAWHEKNPQKTSEYSKRYREKDPERAKRNAAKWAKNHPEKGRAAANKRRALKAAAGGSHTSQDVDRIYKRQKARCLNCCVSLRDGYHVDHIQPLSRGGANGPENLQLLCPSCNMKKHAKDPIQWAQENGRLL